MKTTEDPNGGSLERVVRRHRWTIQSYRRDAIPNTGWRVVQGGKKIMSELTKQAALQLAEDHNCYLTPNKKGQR